jgi:serine/threonine protein kinase/Flp pilus assembly protein TadD
MSDKPLEQSIFLTALELAAPAEREAYLRNACGTNEALRAAVAELLAAHERAGNILDAPPVAAGGSGAQDNPGAGSLEQPGTVIGPYKLIEQIGEGGMGTVWMAQQTEPVKRFVALKLIKAGMDNKQVLARFEAERQALALMDHPNIARVLDVGATPEGRPFFVMELVRGVPVTRYCDEHRLTPRERLELFVPVCQAVQHAHQKGIIHRDLKPSNVLVALYDGNPVPKVIDFGVAKATGQPLTERTLVTGFGAVVGTLEYMSPEQAELNQLDIDTRSDIYALGVLLYELLTGTTPLDRKRLKEAALLEVLRLIREEEPPRPSARLSTTDEMPSVAANRGLEPKQLSSVVRGELDWIAMKALEKDRNRRYDSANGFAQDVQRYLSDEPVLACPPSAAYRLRKFARRNRSRLAVAALLLSLLAVLSGVAAWAVKDRADRRQEAALRQAALEADIGRDLDAALAFCRDGRLREASAVVDRAGALAARGGVGDELGGRVARARADVHMAARLEEIGLERPAVKNGDVDHAARAGRFRDAFREYGLDVTAVGADATAERIRESAIQGPLLAALDRWLMAEFRGGGQSPGSDLLAVLRRADGDPWRGRFREAFGRHDRRALAELARDPTAVAQPPATVVLLGAVLDGVGEGPLAVTVLRSAQQQHPDDFWINHDLASSLDVEGAEPARKALAVGYYRAALALRADSPMAHHNLGNALRDLGDLADAAAEHRKAIEIHPEYAQNHDSLGLDLYLQGDLAGAVAEYRKALALRPQNPRTHVNLGIALQDLGDLAGAIAEHLKAIEFQPDLAEAHENLGAALERQGDLAAALAEHRRALALKPDDADAHFGVGCVISRQGDLAGAAVEYRKALALQPDHAEAHCNLGIALERQGEFAAALVELRRGHELGSKRPRWQYDSADWVRRCQRLAELDARLPGILAGKATAAGAGERIDLAQICSFKQLHRAAARFYAEAFAAEPALVDDASNRYDAACAAALAGCGRGKDAGRSGEEARGRLRRQALDWLRADLAALGRRLDQGSDRAGGAARVGRTLKHWQADSDLAGVRGSEALARLPEAERQVWQKLWDAVADTVARAHVKPTPEKQSDAR